MVHVNELSFEYRSNRILSDLECSLQPGNIYGLLGLNGEGKSTFMKLFAGLLFPKSGTISINSKSSAPRSADYLGQLFYLPDNSCLPALPVWEFARLYGQFYPAFSESDFYHHVKAFDVPRDQNLRKLSLGQNRKVHLAFALACHTPVLIMDEPTNGLDAPSKAAFRKLMAGSIQDDRVYLISTHQIRDVDRILNHLLILKNGQLVLDANLEQLAREYRMVQHVEADDEVIFRQDELFGTSYLIKNQSTTDSNLDVEFVFNAFTHSPKTNHA